RYSTGFPELDRVLGGGLGGGGIVPGSYILLGGDPGIGKSTLMLQLAEKLSNGIEKPNSPRKNVLYIAGEESPHQLKMRAERLSLKMGSFWVYPETDLSLIIEEIKHNQPDVVIIDSIQSIYSPALSGTPGSVGQIKECAGALMNLAKGYGITIFLVGHVTKEGAISGPKLLEHTVDSVLYFEGEKYSDLRILRSVKNRFGNTQEIGVFEIGSQGLIEVSNPSELFLSKSSYQNHPGSVILATVEGSRPLLVELQALVGQSAYATPRRVANGVEFNRLHQVVAVLERRLGLDFSRQDIYVNVVGGLHIEEPAADLAIALAILTSQRNIAILPGTVLAGEIGLTGEIRPIRHGEKRMSEAQTLGFKQMILPQQNLPPQGSGWTGHIQLIGVQTLMEALTKSFAPLIPKGNASENFGYTSELEPLELLDQLEPFQNQMNKVG
ncbi:MAG: DNA repair protein RadA, partial [Cyanobacteria bacterium]|nr:DNA repair protein RadA [Cyanobacteriota bacterium]